MTPRERRLAQMAEKGYLQLTPEERAEQLRQSFEALSELRRKIAADAQEYADKSADFREI